MTESLPDDAPLCPHPMREGENTSNPDAPGRCLLCGLPWEQVEAEQRAAACTCGMARLEREGHAPEHREWCEASADVQD